MFGAYGQHVLPTDDEKTAREKIEAEVRRHSHNFEWHEDGSLTVTHTVPRKLIQSDCLQLKYLRHTDYHKQLYGFTKIWGLHHGLVMLLAPGDAAYIMEPPSIHSVATMARIILHQFTETASKSRRNI